MPIQKYNTTNQHISGSREALLNYALILTSAKHLSGSTSHLELLLSSLALEGITKQNKKITASINRPDLFTTHPSLSWFNHSWQLSTRQQLTHSLLVGWGREWER